jgi:hypothetical protein
LSVYFRVAANTATRLMEVDHGPWGLEVGGCVRGSSPGNISTAIRILRRSVGSSNAQPVAMH